MTYLTQLGEISTETFLAEYWQQKPLLIRQCIPEHEHYSKLITPDELAGLACEVSSARLVQEHGAMPWQVSHGPFQDEDFASLPETQWTLLVNDVDHYLPEFNELLEKFAFIPRWRIDDLMISFAVEGGSVGAHTDEYDVFLFQAQGQRRWQIESKARSASNYRPDLDLRILEQFDPDQEWVLNPGDVLYLPPHIPHHGIALNQCMTYSIGFRAPSQHALLEHCLTQVLDTPEYQSRYQDSQRTLQSNPYQLYEHDLEQLTSLMLRNLDTTTLKRMIGEYLTTAKSIDDETQVHRPACYRIVNHGEKQAIQLFAHGQCYTVAIERLNNVQHLCSEMTNSTINKQKQLISNFMKHK